MVRKLAWLFVAALIIADVVLITATMRGPVATSPTSAGASGAEGFPAPEMVTPTRSSGPGTHVGGSAGTPAPANDSAGSAPVGALPAPSSSHIQVLGVSREEDAPESPAAPGSGGEVLADRDILLQVGVDGLIIRAARGDCPSIAPAALAVSRDFGAGWIPVPAVVSQVLAVGMPGAGSAWFVGSDASCRPVAWQSTDGGATWSAGSVARRWYLNPDPGSTDVAGPGLVADVGCVPRALAGIDVRRAVVLCAGGEVRVTGDSGGRWSTASTLSGAVSLAFASADRGFALAGGAQCRAAVLRTDDGGATWSQRACLGDRVPRAIAAAADLVVAAAGPDLFVSRDAGRHWETAAGW